MVGILLGWALTGLGNIVTWVPVIVVSYLIIRKIEDNRRDG